MKDEKEKEKEEKEVIRPKATEHKATYRPTYKGTNKQRTGHSFIAVSVSPLAASSCSIFSSSLQAMRITQLLNKSITN